MQEHETNENAEGMAEPSAPLEGATPDGSEGRPSESGANGDQEAVDPAPGIDETPEQQMPDSVTLMAMAAMHLPTQDLVRTLVSVFDAQAWRAMGLVPDHSGEVKKDMPSAQLSIDCMAFLLGKIEGTLDSTEKRDVQRRLSDLRVNYMAKLREA